MGLPEQRTQPHILRRPCRGTRTALRRTTTLIHAVPALLVVMHQWVVGCYFERDYRAAEEMARRAIREYPENPRPYLAFAAALGQLGAGDAARAALEAAITASPSIFKFITESRPCYYRPQDHAHLLEGLHKAGWRG